MSRYLENQAAMLAYWLGGLDQRIAAARRDGDSEYLAACEATRERLVKLRQDNAFLAQSRRDAKS